MATLLPVFSRIAPRKTMPGAGVRGIAAFCAVMVWVLGLLAASPELHARVHHDASDSGHACAVTLFSQGLDHPEAGGPLPLAPSLVVVAGMIPCEPQLVESAKDWLLPGRGPPVR